MNKIEETNYFEKFTDYNVLSEKEEEELILLAKQGDKEARDKLIICNMKLVTHIAKKRHPISPLEFLDLVQSGNEGLIKAIDKIEQYNPNKAKLSTYIGNWIYGYMKRAEENTARQIRLPTYLVQAKTKIKKVEEELQKKLNRKPTVMEIKERCPEMNLKIIKRALKDIDVFSLNVVVGENDNKKNEIINFFVSENDTENEVIEKIEREKIKNILKELSEKEKNIIFLKYFKNYSLSEIKFFLNISISEIKEIEKQAKKNILKMLTN